MTARPRSASPGASELIAAFERTDWFRLGPAGTTEWVHFIVLAPGVSVLVNLSLEAPRPGEGVAPRLLLLAYTDRWHGEVDVYHPRDVDLRSARVDAAFGPNTIRLLPDGYHVRAALRGGTVKLNLVLRPLSPPLLALRLPLGGQGDLSWLAAPRMIACGTVEVAGRRFEMEAAPAYHDHNWGRFDWGADLGWEWAVVLPEAAASPWTLLLLRVADRARSIVHAEGVWLWRDGRLVRSWRGAAVSWRSEGFVRAPSVPTVPRAWASLAPGLATGVPRRLTAFARADADDLEVVLTPGDPLRIVAADGAGVTLLHEAPARARVTGRVAGEVVAVEGRAVLEVANG